jgi:NADH-quinone oxidoreductase subunit J
MGTEKLVFYVLSAILVFAAGMVVSVRNAVRAVLFLVLAFFTCAGLWLILEAEFLAIALVLVYVGAVMVLWLFVVMMLDVDRAELREGFGSHLPLGLAVTLLIVFEMVLVYGTGQLDSALARPPLPDAAAVSNVEAIAAVLYTEYVYPFEIAAVILLIGMVAAIGLTFRGVRASKYISPSAQVHVSPRGRMHLRDLPRGDGSEDDSAKDG